MGRHFGNPFSVLGVLLHSYIFDGKSNFPGWYGLSLGAIPSTTILLLFFLLFLLFVHRSAALIAHGQIMLRDCFVSANCTYSGELLEAIDSMCCCTPCDCFCLCKFILHLRQHRTCSTFHTTCNFRHLPDCIVSGRGPVHHHSIIV